MVPQPHDLEGHISPWSRHSAAALDWVLLTPTSTGISKNTPRHKPSSESKRARRSAAGCTQKVKDMGTQGTVQALLCLNGMGNWQVPVPGDYLHTSRIQTSGIAFAASLFTLSTRPSLQTSCCFSKWASTDSMSPQLSPPRAISLDMGMVWAVRAAHGPAPSAQPQLSLLPISSTSKPTSVQEVERPRNAMNIARPPGIQVLVINSSPKSGIAPLTGFSIQNSSRLCHLPAFCRHGTLPCSLGAIQQSRTLWREKHHCETSRDSQGTQHQESPYHLLPRGSHQAGEC